MGKIAVLSDIHGNLSAFTEAQRVLGEKRVNAIIMLGDIIDYGMHSNEVVKMINEWDIPILCNIFGNHEAAIINSDFTRFSSKRGVECAQFTKSILLSETQSYISKSMLGEGIYEFTVEGKRCLAVHGSLEDIYWKAIEPGQDLSCYEKYDYVFSGHSHLPHFFEVFYKTDDAIHRNKKKTVFINPGSVGQPRNLCNLAQFVIWDTDTDSFSFERISYDIAAEQSAYHGQVDDFYRARLETGV